MKVFAERRSPGSLKVVAERRPPESTKVFAERRPPESIKVFAERRPQEPGTELISFAMFWQGSGGGGSVPRN